MAFIKFAADRKKDAKHLKFADEVNEDLYQSILAKCIRHKKVGVIGVSFKPNSPVTIGSPSARLIRDLLDAGVSVSAYDSLEESFINLNGDGEKIEQCGSAQECVDKSDIVAIMHPDKSFATLDVSNVSVVDYWGMTNAN